MQGHRKNYELYEILYALNAATYNILLKLYHWKAVKRAGLSYKLLPVFSKEHYYRYLVKNK